MDTVKDDLRGFIHDLHMPITCPSEHICNSPDSPLRYASNACNQNNIYMGYWSVAAHTFLSGNFTDKIFWVCNNTNQLLQKIWTIFLLYLHMQLSLST